MSDCNHIIALLSDYLDRDLPPDACSAIQAHLDICSTCSEAATSLQSTVDMCRQFRSEAQPGPLAAPKQQELRAAFEKVLGELGGSRRS